MHIAKQYIAGRWLPREGGSAHRGDSIDPASGVVAAHFYEADAADVEACIAAARTAFETTSWRQQPRLRADVLRQFADRLEVRQDEIADMLVLMNGKLRREALGEIAAGISELRYYAGLARNVFGRTMEVEPGCYSLLEREAIGVAAIIVPWNAPVALLIRSLAPALAVGCSVVLKAAHQTACVHSMVIECLVCDERLPAGIVNSFTESGSDATRRLCADRQIDVISFTGSTAVGKAIAETASTNLTRLSLELGGKTPAIVLRDADLDQTVRGIVGGSMVMAGQMCTAISRVLVEAGVRDALAEQLSTALRTLKIGPGNAPQSQMGPLIDIANRERVRCLVEQAADTCEVLHRGGVPRDLPAGGAFLEPSLVALQDTGSPYVQNEIFGPLLVLEVFDSDADCVARANATRFGLAASIWGQDMQRARRLARALKFGTVWFGAHNKLFAEAETGGFRESGFGRLHGIEGLNDFLETKHVYLETGLI